MSIDKDGGTPTWLSLSLCSECVARRTLLCQCAFIARLIRDPLHFGGLCERITPASYDSCFHWPDGLRATNDKTANAPTSAPLT